MDEWWSGSGLRGGGAGEGGATGGAGASGRPEVRADGDADEHAEGDWLRDRAAFDARLTAELRSVLLGELPHPGSLPPRQRGRRHRPRTAMQAWLWEHRPHGGQRVDPLDGGSGPSARVVVRLPVALHELLVDEAALGATTLSAVVRAALAAHLSLEPPVDVPHAEVPRRTAERLFGTDPPPRAGRPAQGGRGARR